MLGDWKEVLKALNLWIKRNKKRQDRAQSAYKFIPNQKRVYYTIYGQKYFSLLQMQMFKRTQHVKINIVIFILMMSGWYAKSDIRKVLANLINNKI